MIAILITADQFLHPSFSVSLHRLKSDTTLMRLIGSPVNFRIAALTVHTNTSCCCSGLTVNNSYQWPDFEFTAPWGSPGINTCPWESQHKETGRVQQSNVAIEPRVKSFSGAVSAVIALISADIYSDPRPSWNRSRMRDMILSLRTSTSAVERCAIASVRVCVCVCVMLPNCEGLN